MAGERARGRGRGGGRGGRRGGRGSAASRGPARPQGRRGAEKKTLHNVYEDSDDDQTTKKQVVGAPDSYEYELPSDFDDEEIDEDGAFNDSDYERYGEVGTGSRGPSKGKRAGGRHAEPSEPSEESEGGSDSEDEGETIDISDLLGGGRDDDILGSNKAKGKEQAKSESDSDEDEEDAGEGSDGDADDARHRSLVSAIASLDGQQHRHKVAETTETAKESEYGVTPRGAKLSLQELMGELSATPAFGGLKKQLSALQSAEVLPVPLARRAKERVNRSAAYQETVEDISKWTSVVKRNREAEHLSFPLNAPMAPAHSNASLTMSFKPETELELEVAQVLEESGDVDGNSLGKGELLDMQPLTLEEVKERRKQLAKMRALMSYYEKKRQRINKIKSKNYHRKLKKEKESKKMADAAMAAVDASEHEKAERLRAEERMTLRHKNTSKWAKRLLQRKDLDPQSRAALEEQLRLGQQLRRKITLERGSDEEGESDSDSDEDFDSEDEEGETGQGSHRLASKMAELKDTLETPLPTTGIMGMKFMQRALERQRREAKTELERLERQLAQGDAFEGDYRDSDREDRDDESESEDEADAGPAEGPAALRPGELVTDKVALSKGHRTAMSGFLDVETGGAGALFEVEDFDAEGRTRTLDPNRRPVSAHGETHGKDAVGSEGESAGDSGSEDEDEPAAGVAAGTGAAGADNPWMTMDAAAAAPGKTPKATKTAKAAKATAQPQPQQPASQKRKAAAAVEETGSDAEDADDAAFNLDKADEEQRRLIERAFAGDNVVEEFEAEKAELEGEGLAKESKEPVLPGWGSWAGDGVLPKAKAQRPTRQPEPQKPPAAPRKDAKLPHVIINEKRDKKAAAKLVKAVPHPFETREQYERSLRNPIGAEWNTPTAVAKQVQPKITTKAGTVIAPLSMTKEVRMKKAAATAAEAGGPKAKKHRAA